MAACWLLVAGLTGCESLQKKFTRKPKHPPPRPSPIVQFQDYTRAMTPLDRYRKHYLMFDYWNEELIEALQASPLNPKRFRRSSMEALAELETLRRLLTEDTAAAMTPLIEERSALDRQLQRGSPSDATLRAAVRALEAQARRMHRDFFWRDVQEILREPGDDRQAEHAGEITD